MKGRESGCDVKCNQRGMERHNKLSTTVQAVFVQKSIIVVFVNSVAKIHIDRYKS
jgi:hypothetical protein